jgi:hypothetical protein
MFTNSLERRCHIFVNHERELMITFSIVMPLKTPAQLGCLITRASHVVGVPFLMMLVYEAGEIWRVISGGYQILLTEIQGSSY